MTKKIVIIKQPFRFAGTELRLFLGKQGYLLNYCG